MHRVELLLIAEMPFSEAAVFIPGSGEELGEGCLALVESVVAVLVEAGVDHAVHASPLLVAPGQERRPGRAADSSVGMIVGEANARAGEGIEVWCLVGGVAVAAELTVAEVVGHDDDEVRFVPAVFVGRQRRGEECEAQGAEAESHVVYLRFRIG